MSIQTKRTRIDASAVSPSDTASTPMAVARNSINTYVESLQPEVATILKRLGIGYLVSLHKLNIKIQQVNKFEDDEELIPISARVNFTLKCSKLVEQDEEYLSLASETNDIVKTFQNDLRGKIIATAKLEVSKLKHIGIDIFCNSLRQAVQTLLVCESRIPSNRLDKIINTLFYLYEEKFQDALDLDIDQLQMAFKRNHTLSNLPPPFITELPTTTTQDLSRTLPPTVVLTFLSKLWRDIESIFILPWKRYLDMTTRIARALELKGLAEEFFTTKSTDDTEMAVESEPPVEPQILKDLIRTTVAAETKKLTNEVNRLKSALAKQQAKNGSRDHSGASKKSGNTKQAAGNNNASVDDKKKKGKSKSKNKSIGSSKKKQTTTKQNSSK